MLSASDLVSLRACVQGTMTTTALLQRNTPADDGQGGETPSWSAGTSVACEVIAVPSRGTIEEGGRPVSVTLWRIRLPYGTDVTAKDRLTVGGAVYELLDVDAGRSDALEVVCSARKLG